ncbi:DUF6607 family protein [Algisphaera agarilytica]|uniref:Secreted protein n=1 Tax=Algisphaera agarilytica TaxID=1385975 RepID=A0A7X0H6B9_9BACT|nr:DUF6607 family protein [Algisphaera agarilytica]MBB6428620.1 hypothetical protein [Algisphaera agarilytica]
MFRLTLTVLTVVLTLTFAIGTASACEPCGCEGKAADKLKDTLTESAAAHDHDHPHTHGVSHSHHGESLAPEADRQAILAMAGEYKVKFQFQETVAIEADYELKDPYNSKATEFVEVIADTGDFISLQHILVMQPRDEEGNLKEDAEAVVVKHWRQDWTYQDTELLEFRGNQTWETVTVDPAKVQGTWSQAVYQVDDSPRYEAYGTWEHVGERSAWNSETTWRPLPRREFSKRSDYQVLVAHNRHTITPEGWVHEQDNHKLVLDDQGQPLKVIAHESGLNVYDRTDDVDFTAGRVYWEKTAAYWEDVREIWADTFEQNASFTLAKEIDGEKLHSALFKIASDAKDNGHSEETKAAANDTVLAYLTQPAAD